MINLKTRNPGPIPILTYHQIAPRPPKGTPYRSLVVAPGDFAKQMNFLKLLGYQGLSISKLIPYLNGEKRGKVIGITFDDGYLNNLENALPILKELGFSSTCYIVTALIGETNVWDVDIGIPQVPLMDRFALGAWVEGGQELGAHTRNHIDLRQADQDTLASEVEGCKVEIESITGLRINHFCYPYGGFQDQHTSVVEASGFITATTTNSGRVKYGDSMLQLPRVAVVRRTSRLGLLKKIYTG